MTKRLPIWLSKDEAIAIHSMATVLYLYIDDPELAAAISDFVEAFDDTDAE